MDGRLEQRADTRGETAFCDCRRENIEFIILASGEKSERADVNSGDGFFKIPELAKRMQHGPIATEHRNDFDMLRKFCGRDTAAFTG